MRRFCLFKRGNIFYVKFWNAEIQKYDSAVSTGKRSRNEALAKVNQWIRYGFDGRDSQDTVAIDQRLQFQTVLYYLSTTKLTDKQRERLIDVLEDQKIYLDQSQPEKNTTPSKKVPLLSYLEEFWDYEKSPYVREKLAYGQSIGKRHCYEQNKRLSHWRRSFSEDTLITDVTNEDLRNFQLTLKERGLAPKSINIILNVGTVAFNWLADHGEIPTNPAAGLRKFSGTSKKRDILSQEEAKRLFSIPWDDERSRVGNLLAMTTGLRAGEVVALQAEDIKDDTLLVRHSWSFADGLKSPKNGEERVVPLLPQIRKELLNLLESNPYGSQGFIFYGVHPDKPMNIDALSRGLTKAYIDISISSDKQDDTKERENTRKDMIKRGICFHSWRHFYTANLADRIEMRTVQLATGHKTSSVAEHYANHKQASHLDLVSKAVADLYEQINLDTTVVPAS